MVNKEEKVVEIESSESEPEVEIESSESESEVEIEESDEGIFDEDLEGDLVLGEEESDFFIGNTILSSGSAVESWAGQNLEDELSRTWVEKDWGSDDEFVGGDVYTTSESEGRNVYGTGVADAYGSSGETEGAYDAKGPYDSKAGEGSYDIQVGGGRLKSQEEIHDNRREGRSMLEVAGFEDKERQKSRDTHGLMKRESGGDSR